MAQTAKEFVADCYQLISPNSPTVALFGDDTKKGIDYINRLIASYSGTGTLLTIAKSIQTTLAVGQRTVTFGDSTYVPTPTITTGRLANIQDAWLLLDGVTYPLIETSRNVFNEAYKYEPLQGLPRFYIITNDLNLTTMRVYPSPSQQFQLNVFGKFQLSQITENSDMSFLPAYYQMFFQFATAKYLAFVKGRADAWTQPLEEMYLKAESDIKAVTPFNLTLQSSDESMLNGSWRVRSGI